MSVLVGAARISENGTINGMKGDQTGLEVNIKPWYLHKKQWFCLEHPDKDVREKIAYAMQKICENDHFGYGQKDRNDCLELLKDVGYDPARITEDVNVDCSLAVLICLRYAGIDIPYNRENLFYTGNMKDVLISHGFVLYTDANHCRHDIHVRKGSVLITRVKGHTVVVLHNGSHVTE